MMEGCFRGEGRGGGTKLSLKVWVLWWLVEVANGKLFLFWYSMKPVKEEMNSFRWKKKEIKILFDFFLYII